jgi:hypothetical protein
MNDDLPSKVRRWTFPLWVAYAVAWIAWWGYRFSFGGGLSVPGDAVTMVLSGVAGLLGLLTGWQMRREKRSNH